MKALEFMQYGLVSILNGTAPRGLLLTTAEYNNTIMLVYETDPRYPELLVKHREVYGPEWEPKDWGEPDMQKLLNNTTSI